MLKPAAKELSTPIRSGNMANLTKTQGFTFVELLVAIAIVGILAVVALPSFLNQKACAHKGPEAQTYVGSLARTQQAYFLEEGRFTSSFNSLGLGVSSETKNYMYSVEGSKDKAFAFGKTKTPQLKSYVAGVFVDPAEKSRTTTIRCIAKEAGMQSISLPIDAKTCGEGTVLDKTC
jgi:type IV pilus assembly protein PilA